MRTFQNDKLTTNYSTCNWESYIILKIFRELCVCVCVCVHHGQTEVSANCEDYDTPQRYYAETLRI